MSATRPAQFSQNLAWPHGTKAKLSIGDNKLHSTVVVGLQQLEPIRQFPVRNCPVLQCLVVKIQLSRPSFVLSSSAGFVSIVTFRFPKKAAFRCYQMQFHGENITEMHAAAAWAPLTALSLTEQRDLSRKGRDRGG